MVYLLLSNVYCACGTCMLTKCGAKLQINFDIRKRARVFFTKKCVSLAHVIFFLYFCTQNCAQMKLLLILLSIMTFTVETKTSVSAEGTWPYDMEATYSCDYQKGTVRAGDVAELHVSGLDGITINAIKVYVKSNQSGGSGTFVVKADGQTIATKSGSYKDWFGAYSTSFQALSLLSSARSGVSDLAITLTGTANSLYIEKYEISWTQVERPAYSVTLMNGDEVYTTLTEPEGDAGVNLPSLPDVGDWHFAAWTAEAFASRSTMPDSWMAPGLYYPKEDGTLWAVYEYQPPIEQTIATELEDGAYIYANWDTQKAMSGGVANGIAGSSALNMKDMNQWYAVTFTTDSTAVIQLMYTYEFIGFSGTQMASDRSEWKVYHEGQKTAFYTEVNGKKYILWPNSLKDVGSGEYVECAELRKTSDLSTTPTVLISVEEMLEDPLLSCYPLAQGMDEVKDEGMKGLKDEWRFPFGPYDLVIKNGKKYIILR